jgi:hypothetical protein
MIGPRWQPPRIVWSGKYPSIHWGSVSMPRFWGPQVKGPRFQMPRFHMPRVRLPRFNMPIFRRPTFSRNGIDWGGFSKSGLITKGGVDKGQVHGLGVGDVGIPGVSLPGVAVPSFHTPWLIWAVVASLSLMGGVAFANSRMPPRDKPSAPFCKTSAPPQFVASLGTLSTRLGPSMGLPLDCGRLDPDSGDTIQQTTTGTAYYRKSNKFAVFTNGWDHWGLGPDRSIVHWASPDPDPPGFRTVASPSPQPALPGLSRLGL